jgi:hypothetical protein
MTGGGTPDTLGERKCRGPETFSRSARGGAASAFFIEYVRMDTDREHDNDLGLQVRLTEGIPKASFSPKKNPIINKITIISISYLLQS